MKKLTNQRLIGDEISIATGNTILIDATANEPIVQMIDEDYREMIASAPEMLKLLNEMNDWLLQKNEDHTDPMTVGERWMLEETTKLINKIEGK